MSSDRGPPLCSLQTCRRPTLMMSLRLNFPTSNAPYKWNKRIQWNRDGDCYYMSFEWSCVSATQPSYRTPDRSPHSSSVNAQALVRSSKTQKPTFCIMQRPVTLQGRVNLWVRDREKSSHYAEWNRQYSTERKLTK